MPDVPALPVPGLVDSVRRVLDRGGALAQVLGGFEPRQSQQQMAEAVARTITQDGVLLAEAGTGTGKTLAYLVPAILSGRKVLVSTGTRNLQQQLIDKDIPLLQRTLGPFRAACMKGRNNYLCLHRFEQARLDDNPRDDATRVAMTLIEHWAQRTPTGDRAELADLPEDLPFWPSIAATTENCLGSECPRFSDCFVTRMRQEAADAKVVIVNHHLLCADAAVRRHSFGSVIPECEVAVIDEAHQLEDVATQYFGIVVSNYRVEQLLTDAGMVRTGPLFMAPREAEGLARAIEGLGTAAREFFLDLQTGRPGVRRDANGG
ncbi:MAG: ATP-dependent DNA helicase, partial [Luteitalea sp.]